MTGRGWSAGGQRQLMALRSLISLPQMDLLTGEHTRRRYARRGWRGIVASQARHWLRASSNFCLWSTPSVAGMRPARKLSGDQLSNSAHVAACFRC
jgi:hypothetical protein